MLSQCVILGQFALSKKLFKAIVLIAKTRLFFDLSKVSLGNMQGKQILQKRTRK